jgi:RNA polymerase sigma factor (sigma-70 family)
MYNPFVEIKVGHENDLLLIHRVLEGSKEALEKLIFRHQAWIYNIALKMVLDPVDAEDITQEILIKLISKLGTYDPGKGAFRTWLYRIVANHVVNMKTSRYELLFGTVKDFSRVINEIPDQTISASPENKVLVEELKIKCITSFLLCLNRRHRLVFILGEIFDVKDNIGSDILEISKANYRKMLSRARKKMSNFMTNNCGLIDQSNPCNCERKLTGYVKNGFVNPDQVEFFLAGAKRVMDIAKTRNRASDKQGFADIGALFGDQPFYEKADFNIWFNDIVTDDTFRDIIHKVFH